MQTFQRGMIQCKVNLRGANVGEQGGSHIIGGPQLSRYSFELNTIIMYTHTLHVADNEVERGTSSKSLALPQSPEKYPQSLNSITKVPKVGWVNAAYHEAGVTQDLSCPWQPILIIVLQQQYTKQFQHKSITKFMIDERQISQTCATLSIHEEQLINEALLVIS